MSQPRANPPHYGAFLKRARQVRGLTQTSLANSSGTSLPTIHSYESKPVFTHGRLHLLAAIIQALHHARPLSRHEQTVLLKPLEDGLTFLEPESHQPGPVVDMPPAAVDALRAAIQAVGLDRVLGCLHAIVAMSPAPAVADAAITVRHPDGVAEFIPRGTLGQPPHAARAGKKAG